MAGSKHHMLTGGLILIALGVLIYLIKGEFYPFSHTWPVLIIVIGFGTMIQKATRFWRLVYNYRGGIFSYH